MTAVRVAGVILAAGKGTRMKSPLPKVLHEIMGRPLLDWVMDSVAGAGVDEVCAVVSSEVYSSPELRARYPKLAMCIQHNQKGTGDAVASAAVAIKGARMASYTRGELVQGTALDCSHVLVCAGDVPGMSARVLKLFVEDCLKSGCPLGVLGMDVPNPKGYGRLVRDEVRGELHRIVEERDATDEIRKLTLCNSGVVFGERQVMFDLLADLRPANAQAEYYLTDVFGLGRERGVATRVYTAPDWTEFLGVNDREQLAHIEGLMRSRQSK